jgi:hypothetical protein
MHIYILEVYIYIYIYIYIGKQISAKTAWFKNCENQQKGLEFDNKTRKLSMQIFNDEDRDEGNICIYVYIYIYVCIYAFSYIYI